MPARYSPSVYSHLRAEGVEARYSSTEVARIFGKTRQWVFYSLDKGRFVTPKGKPIEVERIGNKYSWTSENIKHAAISCYKRRTLSREDMHSIIRDLVTEAGRLNGKYKIPVKKRARRKP